VLLARLYRAWADARTRVSWLPGVALATRNKYMRITWPDGTSVAVGFFAKAPVKSQVAVQHRKLADAPSASQLKQYSQERLEALAELLASGVSKA